MPIGKFVDIAMQVLPAHVVEHAVVTTLKERPEAFNAVCVGLFADILAYRVIHRMMHLAGKPFV